uniref:Solute carrier family 26 member 10 n=1 Tax=Callorhinchus milii TaxID=7868 RepID=A0A4W3ILJ6_CALMI
MAKLCVGMAFALLTSVAPVYGLYTSFFPVVLYMLFGTGRHVSTGTFAVISLMTGSVVESLVPRPMGMNITNIQEAEIEKQRIAVASAVTLLSGLIMIAMFVLQLGVLSTYLSDPIVKAFTSGAAFHVTVSQLSTMLGLRLPRFTGLSTIFKTLGSIFRALGSTNIAELVISVVCLSVLIPTKEINSRFRRKLRIPIPIEIIMVMLATGISFATSLDQTYSIQVVGEIPAGFPDPQLPAVHSIPALVWDTLPITFVGYAVSVSLAMIYAEKHHYTINPNQELLAHGISNTVSSLFTCFPSSASLATTNILESAGGCTQLSGLFTSAVVLVVLLFVGPLFHFLPKAVLACINVISLRQMFLQFQDLPELWRLSKMDFMVWVVTWVAVVTLNAELGLAVGIVFSMMSVVCRTQRATCSVLGRASNTEIYRPVGGNSKCLEISGVKILAYNAPIYYGNKSFFRSALTRLLGLNQDKVLEGQDTQRENGVVNPASQLRTIQAVVIDCSGVIFIDAAGARLFVQMCTECQKGGTSVYLAQCNSGVLRILTHSGLLEHLSPQQIFVTVHDAVTHIEQTQENSAQKNATIWV